MPILMDLSPYIIMDLYPYIVCIPNIDSLSNRLCINKTVSKVLSLKSPYWSTIAKWMHLWREKAVTVFKVSNLNFTWFGHNFFVSFWVCHTHVSQVCVQHWRDQ